MHGGGLGGFRFCQDEGVGTSGSQLSTCGSCGETKKTRWLLSVIRERCTVYLKKCLVIFYDWLGLSRGGGHVSGLRGGGGAHDECEHPEDREGERQESVKDNEVFLSGKHKDFKNSVSQLIRSLYTYLHFLPFVIFM